VAHPEQAASVEEAGAAAVKAAEAGLGTEVASHLAALVVQSISHKVIPNSQICLAPRS
jgi:hypothetical protein